MSAPRLELTDQASGRQLSCAAILFDMDGTLVDSRTCVEQTWRAWCGLHGLDRAALFGISPGRRNRDTVAAVAPHLDVEREVAWLVRAEEKCRQGLRAVNGAGAVLNQIPGQRWAIVTSAWRSLAEIRLRAAGLPLPGVLVSADDVTHGKPHPEGYLRAAEALGVAPRDCVVVEDAAVGLQAAAAAAVPAIGITTSDPSLTPCLWRMPNLSRLTVRYC